MLIIREAQLGSRSSTTTWLHNFWTEMDPSNLIMDNGTFRRIGRLQRATKTRYHLWRRLDFGIVEGDDNLSVSPLDHPEINIEIINGGRLENEGQLWFGSWGDMPPPDDYAMGPSFDDDQ